MRPWAAAGIAAASVLWAVWVGELIGRSFLELLPVIWFMLGFGWVVGWWIGDERFGAWTVLGLGVLAAFASLTALASGQPGAGLPLLIGTVPALLAAPLARAGGRYAEGRRERRTPR